MNIRMELHTRALLHFNHLLKHAFGFSFRVESVFARTKFQTFRCIWLHIYRTFKQIFPDFLTY